MDASPEERWLAVSRAALGYVFIVVLASFGGCSAICSYDFAYLTKPRGGVLCQGRRTLAEAEAKSEVSANYEEVKRREDKHDKTKLAPLLFMRT